MAINFIHSIAVAAARGSKKLKPRDRMCSLRHIVSFYYKKKTFLWGCIAEYKRLPDLRQQLVEKYR